MNKSKLGLVTAMGTLCLGLTLAGVACTGGGASNEVPAEDVSGVVHFLERGEPNDSLGETGDACLVATSGEFFRKTENGWKYEDLTSYAVNDGVLNVSFKSGENENYSLIDEGTTEVGHVHTYGDTYTIYEAKCIIPGIAVKYCTTCKYAFPVVLAVQPDVYEAHEMKEYVHGDTNRRCELCMKSAKLNNDGTYEFGSYLYDISTDANIADVFDQAEDNSTVVVQGETTIDDDTTIEVGDKNLTLDVAGNNLTVEKKTEESRGIVVDGGSLTITDSSATPESEGRGTFTLNVTEADNQSARDEGTYAMRMNNADLTITNVDFEIINSTENNSHAMYVTGGTVNVESDAKITVTQGTKTAVDGTEKQTEGGYGIYISEGAEMNLNATTVKSDGPIFPFVVGNNAVSEEKTVLNINKGTEIYYSDSACSYGAFDVYPNGVVNMAEGFKIVVDGASIDPSKPEGSNYSNAMAFVIIGGGEVNINGEIDLGLDNGMAYLVSILNNYWYENPDADLPSHIILDARCTIGAKAKIIGTSTQQGGGIRFFAAQRNGSEKVYFEKTEDNKTKVSGYSDLILKEGDELYSVFIENGATITLNGEVAKKGVGTFAKVDDGYPGTGKEGDHLGWFTSDAIKDMREFK